jgi:hypothetical protein
MLAALYNDEGKYSESKLTYKDLLTLQEKSLLANSPAIASTLIKLADAPDGDDHTKEQDCWYKKALTILRNHDGATPGLMQAHILQHLGVNCRIRKEYNNAEALYQQALVTARKSLGSDTAVVKSDPLGNDILGAHDTDS